MNPVVDLLDMLNEHDDRILSEPHRTNTILKPFTEAFDELKEILGNTPFVVAGGAARDIWSDEIPKDFDIYTNDSESIINKVEETYPNSLVLETENSALYDINDLMIDIVKKSGNRDVREIISDFDFRCCHFAFDQDNFYYSLNSKKDVLGKTLKIANITNAIGTLSRIPKFLERKYTIDREEILKIGEAIANQDKKEVNEWLTNFNKGGCSL
jgi:hypothetical protein